MSIESAVEVELRRAGDPLRPLGVGVDAVVLSVAGSVGGDFGRRRGAHPPLGHRLDDLRPALGEVLDHRALDPGQVGVAVWIGCHSAPSSRVTSARSAAW